MDPEKFKNDYNFTFDLNEFMNRPMPAMSLRGDWGGIVTTGPVLGRFEMPEMQLLLLPCHDVHRKHRYRVVEWAQTHHPSGEIISVIQQVCLACDHRTPSMHALSEELERKRVRAEHHMELVRREEMYRHARATFGSSNTLNVNMAERVRWYWPSGTGTTSSNKFTNITSS